MYKLLLIRKNKLILFDLDVCTYELPMNVKERYVNVLSTETFIQYRSIGPLVQKMQCTIEEKWLHATWQIDEVLMTIANDGPRSDETTFMTVFSIALQITH